MSKTFEFNIAVDRITSQYANLPVGHIHQQLVHKVTAHIANEVTRMPNIRVTTDHRGDTVYTIRVDMVPVGAVEKIEQENADLRAELALVQAMVLKQADKIRKVKVAVEAKL
jgi:hypothetical protein